MGCSYWPGDGLEIFFWIVRSLEEMVFFCMVKDGEFFSKSEGLLSYWPGLGVFITVSLNLLFIIVSLGPS